MSKVFTITKGLENLGALKTGGQASVYKGKRTGEIISAIKIIPTPVFSEKEDDKNYTSFKNEVQKLTRVNEDANANVVSILSYGITESGNFPYIEMEFIEGPDLSEILKQEGRPIFKIKELLLF
ncbi:MAG: serine/threonine protein kinase, partial [Ferruginibacter sp.]